MIVFEPKPKMSADEFRLISNLIYDYCGIFFHDDLMYLVERRLAPRITMHSLSSFYEYYRFLRYNLNRDKELEEVVELLTTNETYFFREEYQLKAFSEEILPDLIKRNSVTKRIRIWSAGCSTGEEAFSIGILIRENPRLDNWDVEIFANDISRRVIQSARRGVFGKSSFRAISPLYVKKYFSALGDRFMLDESVRALVSFGQLNLLDNEMLQLIGKVDVIFCRNVLIYFDSESKHKVVKTFFNKLEEGGYLLLGHSESLINITTDFELVHFRNDLVYRKPKSTSNGRNPT